jgi:hypothetical protein
MSDSEADTEAQCARCGSSTTWIDCESCDEFGMAGHDCGEDSCCCEFPEENKTCNFCGGHGGWLTCLSGPEWCEANPSPGHENTPSGEVEWFSVPTDESPGRRG